MKYGIWFVVAIALLAGGCASSYKAQPLPFKLPGHYANSATIAGAEVAAEAFADDKAAEQLFGFDIRGAGMLPVRVVFDNRGSHSLEINPAQTFLVDADNNLWPVLSDDFAYDRVTHYAQTKSIFKQGAYGGALGAVAGAVVGAAVGVVSGENVGNSAGKGAAVGAAAGGLLGAAKGGDMADDANQRLMDDFNNKSLKNQKIAPGDIAFGFIFFPGEAQSATRLRLQLLEGPYETPRTVMLDL